MSEIAKRKIRMGMVGGGEGAFIGAVHRLAAALDGQIELVCGAFSSDPERSRRSGEALFLPSERCYPDYHSMMQAEANLPASERMDFVAIVTPNHLHLPVALAAFAHGFHVLSDKPATLNLAEAEQLAAAVDASGLLYGLSHTYTGYPMVKAARDKVANAELGAVRKVYVEYPQGWLAQPTDSDNKQASWRLDPAQSGISSCMGDIGVHAANLAEFICGSAISEVCAELNSIVPGRALDDDGAVLLRFANGVSGVLIASQVAVGEENALSIRVYGDKASLEWHQEEPNTLVMKYQDKPREILRAGWPGSGDAAAAHWRTPAGHPEGYLEAFANIYRSFAEQLRATVEQRSAAEWSLDMPSIEAALSGMRFIEGVVAASHSEKKWHAL